MLRLCACGAWFNTRPDGDLVHRLRRPAGRMRRMRRRRAGKPEVPEEPGWPLTAGDAASLVRLVDRRRNRPDVGVSSPSCRCLEGALQEVGRGPRSAPCYACRPAAGWAGAGTRRGA